MISNNFHGERALRIVIGITLLVFLMADGTSATTPISSCTTISSPGEYVLNGNINNYASSTCIRITSSDVVFDGNGFVIDGIKAGSTYGVYAYNPSFTLSNITIKNLITTDWDNGIWIRNSINNLIINNTAYQNNKNGIAIKDSNNNELTGNDLVFNGQGIWVEYSTNNKILSNNLSYNFLYSGIGMLRSNNNNISGNNLLSNNHNGIWMNESNNNLASFNNASNAGSGIVLMQSNNNKITRNKVFLNQPGILLNLSSNNMIANNTMNSNAVGIVLEKSSQNTITGNIASENEIGYGFQTYYELNYNDFDNNIDTTNLVNGKPVYYYLNKSDLTIEGIEAGRIICAFCNNSTIININASNVDGIVLFGSHNITIINAESTKNVFGVGVLFSDSINIKNSNISNNYMGVRMINSYMNNITNNIIKNSKITATKINFTRVVLLNGTGIMILGSDHNNISNNDVSNNFEHGITLIEQSNNNSVIGNIASSNGNTGIRINYSDSNIVTNNKVSKNNYGIWIESSFSNRVLKNVAENNTGDEKPIFPTGIRLLNTSHTIIEENKATRNYVGISIVSSHYNEVKDNLADSNYYGIGIGTPGNISTENTIISNTILNNYYGIYSGFTEVSLNNKIYHNNILNNSIQSQDNGTNSWNSSYPEGGNFWSDYNGADLKKGSNQDQSGSDSIGDIPYNISGGAEAQDRYPFMQPNGWVSPVIPFPDTDKAPTDQDGDGLYEDINGNGWTDFNDVVMLFNDLEWVASNEPISSFDFNGNQRIDFNDIIKLFEEL